MVPMLRTKTTPVGWESEELLRSANATNDPAQPPDAWAIRTPGYLYAETTSTGEVELYDLAADPYQLQNVAADPLYLDERIELQDRLAALKARP